MKEYYLSPGKPWRFFSTIISAIIIVSIILPFTAVTAYALDVPQPTYPDNFATTTPDSDPPLGVPSFYWSAVTGANVYRLQVDSEIGFNQPIYLDTTTRNITFTPSSTGHLFTDGEWYWRVRVDDPAPVGNWSPIFTFTKSWATPENKPVLLAPAEGDLLPFFDTPAFSWTPVIGAARYRFQIAISPGGFDSPLLSVDTLATSHQPTNRLTNGLYYWRIVPMDAVGHLGTPSNIQSFSAAYGTVSTNMVPTLVIPEDESFPTFTPTFHWTAVEGAEHYRLEYTSDETCDFSVGTGIETRQTSYTPTDTFSNDFRYCWRVRVESGPAVGDWSETWHFQKRWNLQPVLLTPTQLYQTGLYPLYSWTPVPGAASYQIQISIDHFSHIQEEATTANTFYTPQNYDGDAHYWWRVRPIDGGGEFGLVSSEAEFQSVHNSLAPILVYPFYYYLPDNYSQAHMFPYEDRTVASPIFIWHRVMIPPPAGGILAASYRIQVAETPYFNPVIWQSDTENTSATPTSANDFIPNLGQDYYWRVCPLNGYTVAECLVNPSNGLEWWSQIWRARFDNNLRLTPTTGMSPELLRPAFGQESVEATPLLEWWPYEDSNQNPATEYQVQVSHEESFATHEISETVSIPAYSPVNSLAQRSLNRIDYGSFYWRVRGLTVEGWSDWSDVWRFQIASQSEFKYYRSVGNDANRVLIGTDPVTDTVIVPSGYNLSTLFVSQDNANWYFGFNTEISTTDMTYVFYIDLDNIDGSGGNVPPERNYSVSTIPAHQPEYVFYVDEVNGVINTQNSWVFTWNGSSWEFGDRFADIGANVYISPTYVELQVPSTAIGMSQDTSSASVMLFSVDIANNEVMDTVPADPQVPGNAILSRFSAVSDHMNLISPPNTATGDPMAMTSVLPFYWDWPTGSYGTTPFAGSIVQVDLDEDYSPPHDATYQTTSNTAYFSKNHVTPLSDIVGDNIYYWRVQPRYVYPGTPEIFGAWTKGWSFRRLGFKPQNLFTSITFSTPTFGWDMAEGAYTYRLQVATDPNFSNRVVEVTTPMNTYTPSDTLANGFYYWRVQINRVGSSGNDWSDVQQFTLTSPTPTGLTPDQTIVHSAPSMCWDPLVGYVGDEKVLTAWKYHVQVSQDPNFSTTYDATDTFNNCWTPISGYYDGAYYWRVVMIDGSGKMGVYSPSATFTKQYPITTLISPINEPVSATPTFIWTPVHGAATYAFEVSKFSTFYPLYDWTETINTQYSPPNYYTSNQVYYWRVAIRDAYGRLGPYTDARIIIGEIYPSFLPLVGR